jgi:hypothetical protein
MNKHLALALKLIVILGCLGAAAWITASKLAAPDNPEVETAPAEAGADSKDPAAADETAGESAQADDEEQTGDENDGEASDASDDADSQSSINRGLRHIRIS